MTRLSRADLEKWASDVRADIHKTRSELDALFDLAGWIDRQLSDMGVADRELFATPPRTRKYRTITTEQLRDFIRKEKRVTRKQMRMEFGVSDAQIRTKLAPLLEKGGPVIKIIPDDHGPHEYQYLRPMPYPGPRSRPRTEDPSAIGRGFVKRGDPIPGTGRPFDKDKFPGPTKR